MLSHFDEYGYQGIFLALVMSGLGFPLPEEIPVITAGILCGHQDTSLKWYIMLPVLIVGVVISDGFLYGMGRFWGSWFLGRRWVQRHILPPEKRAQIEKNFHDRGIAVLLGARLLPGIRSPVFIMAGVLRVPLGRFLLADALYAIPGVNILFWLAFVLTDQVMEIFKQLDQYRPLVIVAILSGIAGAIIQRYFLSRKVSTGEPPHVPQIISKPAEAVVHVVEKAAGAVAHVAHRHHDRPPEPTPPEPAPDVFAEPSANGVASPAPATESPKVVPPG
jgi:membrane protein DedA with SNARE-associated domain